MALRPCRECGQQVSTMASVCPRCGMPSPTDIHQSANGSSKEIDPAKRRGVGSLLAVLALVSLGLIGSIVGFNWPDTGIQLGGGLPSCASNRAISDAQSALADAPIGRTFGVKIIDFRNPREVSRSSTHIRCLATVKLNSGVDGELDYLFSVENGKMFVYAKLN